MTDKPRVLVVEDEPAIREAVAQALLDAGMRVSAAADGADFRERVQAFRPDLAVLDVMLPGRDGLALARDLSGLATCPVIFLTARDAVADRLAGFDVGADDYVVKPFVLEELLARVRAVLRRSGRLTSAVVEVDDLVLDEEGGTAVRGGTPVDLTATELRLLAYLARHPGQVLSKTQLLTQVWGYEAYDANLVEVHVSAVRRKLERHGPRLLHTVRGQGYRLQSAAG